jgi:hypothetical protein
MFCIHLTVLSYLLRIANALRVLVASLHALVFFLGIFFHDDIEFWSFFLVKIQRGKSQIYIYISILFLYFYNV